jgi:uridine kinase
MPLYNNEISSLAVLKVFVDTPLDECFIRRLLRDKNERGRSIQSIVDQ